LRGWVKQADIDAGEHPGTTTYHARRIKDLEREVKDLKRANKILVAASSADQPTGAPKGPVRRPRNDQNPNLHSQVRVSPTS
jgi:transposase-like protein